MGKCFAVLTDGGIETTPLQADPFNLSYNRHEQSKVGRYAA